MYTVQCTMYTYTTVYNVHVVYTKDIHVHSIYIVVVYLV